MNIAVVTSTYPPYKGGIGNVAYHFAASLKKRGHTVTVFTPRYKSAAANGQTGVQLLKPFGSYGNAAFLPQLFFILRRFDVIHLHLPFIGAECALALLKLQHPKVRLVTHYHMDLIGTGISKPLFFLNLHIFIRFVLLVSDRIIVTSDDYARESHLSRIFKKRGKHVFVIPNGISYKEFASPKKSDQATSFRPYALFVGGLDSAHYFKGLPILLKAWEEVHKTLASENLVIVGEGNVRLQFERDASGLAARDSIHFVGKVTDDELISLYQNARMTILPSTTKSEAFGIVILESLAAGTPVVASALPGVRTLVEEGSTGWLAEPNSMTSLAEKIANGIKYSDALKGSDALKVFAKKFDWPILTDRLEKVLTNGDEDSTDQ